MAGPVRYLLLFGVTIVSEVSVAVQLHSDSDGVPSTPLTTGFLFDAGTPQQAVGRVEFWETLTGIVCAVPKSLTCPLGVKKRHHPCLTPLASPPSSPSSPSLSPTCLSMIQGTQPPVHVDPPREASQSCTGIFKATVSREIRAGKRLKLTARE